MARINIMRTRKTKIFAALALTGGLYGLSGAALATTCNYDSDNRIPTGAIALQVANLTVGRDVPLGTIVYKQNLQMGAPVKLICNGGPFDYFHNVILTNLAAKSAWQPQNGFSGKVYQSGVPGIGVAYYYAPGIALPTKTKRATASNCMVENAKGCTFDYITITTYPILALIKTGDVSPGSISGAVLPVVEQTLVVNDANFLLYRLGLTGTINIVASTCSTSDVIVPMGTHKAGSFQGVNTGSAWKDFAIKLSNCPAFHGLYKDTGPTWTAGSKDNPASGKATSKGSRDKNTVAVRIDAAGEPLDAANGVLNLDASGKGLLPSASGIGLQIGDRDGKPIALATIVDSGLALQSTSANYSIQLRARYLQTAATVTPGPANATATFTLNYQ